MTQQQDQQMRQLDQALDALEETWSGQAELIDMNGEVIAEVAANLWKRSAQGRGVQWGGTIARPPDPEQHLPTAEYSYTLRLLAALGVKYPEGAVVPHGAVRISFASDPVVEQVEVVGTGEPPF